MNEYSERGLPKQLSCSAFHDEMDKIGRQVHDGIGQAIVALRFMAEAAINAPEKDTQTLTEMLRLIQETQSDVRKLYNGLLSILEKTK